MTIIPMASEHVRAVARLHCAHLRGLLSELGVPAARAYYRGCVHSRLATAFVAVEGGEVQGFVLGSTQPDALRPDILRAQPLRLTAAVIMGIVRRPRALTWLLGSGRGLAQWQLNTRVPELTYVAVSDQRRGAGIGRQLLQAFTTAMRTAGVKGYELSVDAHNEAAIAFYERLGFQRVGTYQEFDMAHFRYALRIE